MCLNMICSMDMIDLMYIYHLYIMNYDYLFDTLCILFDII